VPGLRKRLKGLVATREVAGSGVAGVVVAVAAGVVAILVVLAGLAAQPGGLPGTTPDGVAYLAAAENLASGRGLVGSFTTGVDLVGPADALAFGGAVPMVQWPPGLPAALGAVGSLGGDPRVAAGVVNALSLGVLVAAVAWATYRIGRSLLAAAVAALVVALPVDAALLLVTVSSEPLFCALVFLSVMAAVRYLVGGGPAWMAATFALAGAATLTRYAGVAVIAGLALALGRFTPVAPEARSRWTRVVPLGAGALAVLPAVAWSVWTSRAAGVPTRLVGWHPPGRAQWDYAASTLTSWVVGPSAPWGVRVVVVAGALGLVVLAFVGWRHQWSPQPATGTGGDPGGDLGGMMARAWWRVVAMVVPAYLLVVVATHTLFDRVVPRGGRLLVPILALVVPLVAGGVAVRVRQWRHDGRHRLVVAAATAAAALVVVSVVSTSATWREQLAGDPGVVPAERSSATTAWLDQLPDGVVVASNEPAFTWLSVPNRQVISVPVRDFAAAGRPNPDFPRHLEELADAVAGGRGVVVLYDVPAALSPEYVTAAELLSDVGLQVVAVTGDATVFASDPPPGRRWPASPTPLRGGPG